MTVVLAHVSPSVNRAGAYVLLALVVLIWAVSWPIIRLGVSSTPPIWYACYRYAVAAPCLFALVALRGQLRFPPRRDWALVLICGGLQMAGYSALTSFALTRLPPGRASVLAFSTPIWVALLAAYWLEERLSRRSWLGVVIGIAGALAIAAPTLHAETVGQVLACCALLLAAISWSISIVYVRAHVFEASALALAPWQSMFAVVLLVPCALLVERRPPRIGVIGALSLAYVAPVATAFAYWAVVEAGRRLRAGTMSIAMLATPPIGILISVLTLHESVNASLVVGVLLIGGAFYLTCTPLEITKTRPE